jgi:hypothetical protein
VYIFSLLLYFCHILFGYGPISTILLPYVVEKWQANLLIAKQKNITKQVEFVVYINVSHGKTFKTTNYFIIDDIFY